MTAAPKADPGIGRDDAPVGSKAWAERVRLNMQGIVSAVRTEPEGLKFYVDLVKKHEAWTLMNRPDGTCFASFEEFCEHRQPWGLGKPWRELKLYIVAAFGGNEAQVEALTTTAAAAPTQAEATAQQPRDEMGKVAAKPEPDNDKARPEKAYGTSAAYLTARIARDAPAVHERMKAGEFRSVRAAAIEAGVVKAKLKADPHDGQTIAVPVERWDLLQKQIKALQKLCAGPIPAPVVSAVQRVVAAAEAISGGGTT